MLLFRRIIPMLCLVLLLWLCACDSSGLQEEQEAFEQQAFTAPKDITQTNEAGEVLVEDEDDWRTAPLFVHVVRIEPANPNPASSGFINVPVTLTRDPGFPGGLLLAAREGGTGDLRNLERKPEATIQGLYIFTFSPSDLGTKGLHRVWLFAGTGELVSYGDILVE